MKGKIVIVYMLILVFVMAGCKYNYPINQSYGGHWANAESKPLQISGKSNPGPGDTLVAVEENRVVKNNFNHLKQDFKHMTSKEKIEGIKSEIPLLNKNQNQPYLDDTSSAAANTDYNYLKDKNVIIGGGMGLIGLVCLVVFPVFGFVILLVGAMIGIIGLYNVRHPEDRDYTDDY